MACSASLSCDPLRPSTLDLTPLSSRLPPPPMAGSCIVIVLWRALWGTGLPEASACSGGVPCPRSPRKGSRQTLEPAGPRIL